MKKAKKAKEKWRIQAFPAIVIRIVALALAMWLAAMGYITVLGMEDAYDHFAEHTDQYKNGVGVPGVKELPGADYCKMFKSAEYAYKFATYFSTVPLMDDHYPDNADTSECDPEYVTSMIFFSLDGNVLLDEGRYAYLSYQNQEGWYADEQEMDGYTYIDFDKTEWGRQYADAWGDDKSRFWWFWVGLGEVMRFTGYFEGAEFCLTGVAVYERNAQSVNNPERLSWGELDQLGRLPWQVEFDDSQETDRELVSIYVTNFEAIGYSPEPVESNGVTFESLGELVKADMAACFNGEGHIYTKKTPLDAVIIESGYWAMDDGTVCRTALALRFQPLPFAMARLWKVYLVTFLAVALAVFLILRAIKHNLTAPVAQVARSARGNPVPLQKFRRIPKWREACELEECYTAMVQELNGAQNREKQLTTALEYAKNAEESRRQMVSNITHELKTPLAIIHSYAEGLQAGIAADKQEQYIATILEETERMDAMVLEMLDLSRLEAGKVRLAADQFSLCRLVKAVFEKLSPAVEEKELQLIYGLAEEFEITADEARIGQVVTNFATNAIKYTPRGGKIWIKVFHFKNQTIFAVENECQPLSDEALTKVWDSFYRADPSRSEKGTGLGLTVAKTIIELHRGSCQVTNTSNGVEFRFTMP